MIYQTTLAKSSETVEGIQLDKEAPSTVRFHPAPPDHGITFIRHDLPGSPTIKCHPANLQAEARWTSLVQDGIWVHHTEHILAALIGNGIDNAMIEIHSDRIPVVSAGSCKAFSEALLAAGIRSYDLPRRVLKLREPIYYETLLPPPIGPTEPPTQFNRAIIGLPSPDFSASYIFHVPGPSAIRIGLAEYHPQIQPFAQTIGQARTYFLHHESTALEELLSSVRKQFLIVTPESLQSLVNEVANHKIVDFIGDLAVLGLPLIGRFVIFRSGHRLHHDFTRMLVNNDLLEPTHLS